MAFISPSIAAVAPTLRHLPALRRVPPARGAVVPCRTGATMAASSLADLGRIADIDGGELSLAGRPAFVVNVASECGYTASGYQMMKDLLAKYGDSLAVVAVPCNAFGMYVCHNPLGCNRCSELVLFLACTARKYLPVSVLYRQLSTPLTFVVGVSALLVYAPRRCCVWVGKNPVPMSRSSPLSPPARPGCSSRPSRRSMDPSRTRCLRWARLPSLGTAGGTLLVGVRCTCATAMGGREDASAGSPMLLAACFILYFQ